MDFKPIEPKQLDKITDRKKRSLKVSDLYMNLATGDYSPFMDRYIKRSTDIKECGTFLQFKQNTKTGDTSLHRANFCKKRLCPMCAWRKSLENYYWLNAVVAQFRKEYPDGTMVFVTLTQKNSDMSVNSLSEGLTQMLHGFTVLNKELLRSNPAYLGAFRSLEITINKEDRTFHPHLHCIFFFKKGYFSRKNKGYITQEMLCQEWQKAIKVDYKPLCSIEAIKDDTGLKEVTKYVVKDEDYVEDLENTKILEIYEHALHGRRFTAYTGEILKIYRKLKEEDKPEEVPEDDELSYIFLNYHWNLNAYALKTVSETEDEAGMEYESVRYMQGKLPTVKYVSSVSGLDEYSDDFINSGPD